MGTEDCVAELTGIKDGNRNYMLLLTEDHTKIENAHLPFPCKWKGRLLSKNCPT